MVAHVPDTICPKVDLSAACEIEESGGGGPDAICFYIFDRIIYIFNGRCVIVVAFYPFRADWLSAVFYCFK